MLIAMQHKMNKLFTYLLLSIFLISFASAVVCDSELPNAIRQGSSLNLTEVCDNCTYVNVTKVLYPNQSFAFLGQLPMTKNGTNYYVNFAQTKTQGQYIYTTTGDLNGIITSENICFQVTPSGQSGSSNIVFFLLIIFMSYGITIFGFGKKEEWIVILGSGLLITLGLYMIRNGIIETRDWYTNYLAYATWGVGVITGLMATLSLIDANM